MMGSGKSIDVLAAALNDSNQYVRSEAAASLGKLGSEKSVNPLLRASRDDSSVVRQAARDALVKIGSPASPAIARTLRDPDPQVRWTAALMLGKIASEQAVPALIEALSDADWMVANEAAVALARIRSERSVAQLKALLQGQNANLSTAASWILAEIQAPRTGPYLRAIEDQRRAGIQDHSCALSANPGNATRDPLAMPDRGQGGGRRRAHGCRSMGHYSGDAGEQRKERPAVDGRRRGFPCAGWRAVCIRRRNWMRHRRSPDGPWRRLPTWAGPWGFPQTDSWRPMRTSFLC